jgi:hypothetical protein
MDLAIPYFLLKKSKFASYDSSCLKYYFGKKAYSNKLFKKDKLITCIGNLPSL